MKKQLLMFLQSSYIQIAFNKLKAPAFKSPSNKFKATKSNIHSTRSKLHSTSSSSNRYGAWTCLVEFLFELVGQRFEFMRFGLEFVRWRFDFVMSGGAWTCWMEFKFKTPSNKFKLPPTRQSQISIWQIQGPTAQTQISFQQIQTKTPPSKQVQAPSDKFKESSKSRRETAGVRIAKVAEARKKCSHKSFELAPTRRNSRSSAAASDRPALTESATENLKEQNKNKQ